MKPIDTCIYLLAIVSVATLAGCSTTSTKASDVSSGLRTSLVQAGLKDVTVSQDRDLAVITLGGHVSAESDKTQAEAIAKSLAGNQVVANQISVAPPGAERDAKKIDADLDKGIEGNLDAALVSEHLRDALNFSIKNSVVTLTGEVDSQAKRARAEVVAGGVPNVRQVVNELQVKGQKASSSR
jgi:osmotically-inducible protein OsmY